MAQFNYNEQANSGGIYIIFNNHNWRTYIGSCKVFKIRWKHGHYKSLLKGKHQNKFIQADFNKCRQFLGHDDFLEFHILENMPNSTRGQRLEMEEKWIKVHFDNGNQCYNLCDRAISREGFSAKNPEETRKLISENTKKQWSDPQIRDLMIKRQKESSDPNRMKKALEKRWNGPGNEIQRKEAADRSRKRWQENPLHVQKVKAALRVGRTRETYEKTHQKNVDVFRQKTKLVQEIKNFEGKKENKSKLFTAANLVSPDGRIMYANIFNLGDFAHHIGISDSWKLQEIILGKRLSYKGWFRATC
jgi:group I intron endonuclease